MFWELWATENSLERLLIKSNVRGNIDIKWNLESPLNMFMIFKEINQGTSVQKNKKCEIKMNLSEERENKNIIH